MSTDNNVSTADASIANPISCFRGRASAFKEKINNPTAIPIVDADTAQLLSAGEILNSLHSNGNTGWNKYNWAKTESPDKNMLFLMRRNRRLPLSAFIIVDAIPVVVTAISLIRSHSKGLYIEGI